VSRRATLPAYVGHHLEPKKGWQGPVERIASPIQRSVILLTWCAVCRQYMLEGSAERGHCLTCGTPR
jgi:hypothetical protein